MTGEEGDDVAEEESGVFNPAIDSILWKRASTKEDKKGFEYFVKFHDYSYVHCEWIAEEDILSMGKAGKNKLNRFNRMFDKKIAESEVDVNDKDAAIFDPSYIEVDKILYCSEIFPVIHPKKANEVKGKWSEHLIQVVSKLLNYTKDDVHYGVYFMEPVDPDRDSCSNYRKVIPYPMDLGTINNRLYLDYYKSYNQFWYDLGFVFKNARRYNKDITCDIRILVDTLREYAKILYQRWHAITIEKCEKMKQEYEEKHKEAELKFQQMKDMISENVTTDFTEKVNEIKLHILEAQKYAKESDFDNMKVAKANYVEKIAKYLYLFGSQPQLMAEVVQDLERALTHEINGQENN